MPEEQRVCDRGRLEKGILICPNKDLKRRGSDMCDYALIGEMCPLTAYQLEKEEQDKARGYK